MFRMMKNLAVPSFVYVIANWHGCEVFFRFQFSMCSIAHWHVWEVLFRLKINLFILIFRLILKMILIF